MDYGHTTNSNEEPAFFTPGIGNAAADQNNLTPENNLNTTENAWTFTAEPHNTRNLGNRAIFSGETSSTDSLVESNQSPALGEIINLNHVMPAPEAILSQANINQSLIHPQGDRISDDTVNVVKNILKDFGATYKPLDDTYNEMVAVREAYQAKLIERKGK